MFVKRGIFIIGLTVTFMPIGTVFSGENENYGISHQMTANGKATKRKKIFEEDREQKRVNENEEEHLVGNEEEPVENDMDVAENEEEQLRTFPDLLSGTETAGQVVTVESHRIECLLPNGGQNTPIFADASCYIVIQQREPGVDGLHHTRIKMTLDY